MKNRVMNLSVGLVGLCALVGGVGAAPSNATVGPVSCTSSDVAEGLCVPYVAAPGEDPMAEAGSTYTTSGPRITPTTWTCKTFDESGLWDVVVREWSNCNILKSPFSARSIDWQGWFQPYEKGKSFHLEYTAKFRVEGDTNGAEFGKYWNSYRYKIIAPGDARYLQ